MSEQFRTVIDGLLHLARTRGEDVAFRTRDGDTWSWTSYLDRAARFAGGLRRLGVGPGDRVVLMLKNRREFHVADVGALLAGATPISIYNSSAPDQIAYLAGHCGAVVAVTEDGDFAERVLAAAGDVPALRTVVVVGHPPQGAISFDEV